MNFEEIKQYKLIIENQSELNIAKNFFHNIIKVMKENNFNLLETKDFLYSVGDFEEIINFIEQIDDGDTLLRKREKLQYERYESDEMTDDEYHFHSAGL